MVATALIVLSLAAILGTVIYRTFSIVEVDIWGKDGFKIADDSYVVHGISPGHHLELTPFSMEDFMYEWVEMKKVPYGHTFYYREPDPCLRCQFAIRIAKQGSKIVLTELGVVESGEARLVRFINPLPLQTNQPYSIRDDLKISATQVNFKVMEDGSRRAS